ncbi:MAG: di-heme oxidoredictase family protein [Solirubrobacteraceae bacterium]
MRARVGTALALIAACIVAVVVARAGDRTDSERDRSLSGGSGTVEDATTNAFALALRTLSSEDRRAFAVGNSFFNRNWVGAPASATGRDGLGPTFNAQSCSSCHLNDGRGRPPSGPRDPERGLLLRRSVGDANGSPQPVRLYGGQLQDRAIDGVPAEGRIRITHEARRGRYGDGTPYTLLAAL